MFLDTDIRTVRQTDRGSKGVSTSLFSRLLATSAGSRQWALPNTNRQQCPLSLGCSPPLLLLLPPHPSSSLPLPSLSSTWIHRFVPGYTFKLPPRRGYCGSQESLGAYWVTSGPCATETECPPLSTHAWEHWFHSGHRIDFSNPAQLGSVSQTLGEPEGVQAGIDAEG